jgi:hypothetical protein
VTHLDFELVTWLRNQVQAAVDGMDERTPAMPRIGNVSAYAFGNTLSSALCYEGWRDTTAEAETAFGYLRLSLEADVGRLDAIMHTFLWTDAEAADDLCVAAMRSNTLDVYNTHVDTDAGRRSGQLDQSVDHIESQGGPAIFAGDLNTADPPHVDRLKIQGWTDASTDANGNPVPTYKDRPIDKVYVGPGVVVTDPARSIDGGPSDHDGLVVDVGIPPAWP